MLNAIDANLFRARLLCGDVFLLHAGLPIIMVGIPCAECTPACVVIPQLGSEARVYSL